MIWQDVRLAARQLTKNIKFTTVAVLALALGIGVSNTFFTLVDAICVQGLPITSPDRVVLVETRDDADRPSGLTLSEFADLQRSSRSFSSLGAYSATQVVITEQGRAAARVGGAYASAATFVTLGEVPERGRAFTPADDVSGAAPVVLLGTRLWQARYAGDPEVLGRVVTVNGIPATVVGILRDGFRYPGNSDLWISLGAMPLPPSGTQAVSVIGRLGSTSSLVQVASEVDAASRQWARELPPSAARLRVATIPINDRFNGRIADPVWIAFMTVGALVLIIACANVANLLLMRAVSRAREIGIRISLGATRPRLVRQLLIESALLALLSSIVGLGLARAGLAALTQLIPADTLPYWITFSVNGHVLGALVAASVTSVFIFGLAPAIHLARTDPQHALNDHSHGTSGRAGTRRWTAAFLAAEFALTLVLLAGVALSVRQGQRWRVTEYQIKADSLLSMWVTLPNQRYGTPANRTAFYDRLLDAVSEIRPGVVASVASAVPSGGGTLQSVSLNGRAQAPGEPAPTVVTVSVGPRYFEVLNVPMKRGSAFSRTDANTVVVNQRFVDMYLAEREPLGEKIRIAPPRATMDVQPWLRIVGVAPTVRQRTAGTLPDPVVYVPYQRNPPATTALLVRADGDPVALAEPIREVVRRLDADLPLYRVMTLERAMTDARWNGRMSNALLNSVGAIAFGLALVGLFAVTTYAVGQRRREIGVRASLGARPSHVRWLILRQALKPLAAGLGGGVVLTYVFDRYIAQSTPDTLRMTDMGGLMPAVTAIVIAASAACLGPAIRASLLNPADVLRSE